MIVSVKLIPGGTIRSALKDDGMYFFDNGSVGLVSSGRYVEVSAQEHLEQISLQTTETGLLARWVLNITREGGSID